MPVTVILRPKGHRGAAARFKSLCASPCFAGVPGGWTKRVSVMEGDLSQPGAGLSAEDHRRLTASVTHVVHCAASVDFELPIAEAIRSNVDSALNVMELARACPHLKSVVSVSTAYVTPNREGAPIKEVLPPLTRDASRLYDLLRGGVPDEARLLNEMGRPNTYTLTKALCEHLLVQRYHDLPLTILRPSIISASCRRPVPGWIDSSAAFAAFVYLVGIGHLHTLTVDPQTKLDIVPCDVVAAHILGRVFDPPPADAPPRICHSTVGLDRAPTVRDAAEETVRFFREYQVDRWPHVRYVGTGGHTIALARMYGHLVRLVSLRGSTYRARVLKRLRQADEINRRFRYFMENAFDFRTTLPWPEDPPTARDYIRTICRGIYRYMMRGNEENLLVAGRQHRRIQSDWHWMFTRPVGGLGTRLSLARIRRRLARWAHRITVDEPALIAGRHTAPPGSMLLVFPVVNHSRSTAALISAYTILTRRTLGFGPVWVIPEAELPRTVRENLPDDPTAPRALRRPWVIVARDRLPEVMNGSVHRDPVALDRLLAAGTPLVRLNVHLNTNPDEHTLSQQEDASSLLLGRTRKTGGTRLLRQIAGSLPAHHGHVRSAHLRVEPEADSEPAGSAIDDPA